MIYIVTNLPASPVTPEKWTLSSSESIIAVQNIAALALAALARDPNNADAIALKLNWELGNILGGLSTQVIHRETVSLWSKTPPLLPAHYAIPPALEEVHKTIYRQLSSKKKNGDFTHSGLLLYWPPGMGKSEYVRFLSGVLGKKIITYTAQSSEIRKADSPASALIEVYRQLQLQAEETGAYIVLFIDEFDIFMTPFSSIKTEVNRSSNSDSERSRSHHQTKSEMTIDEVGSQLFATLKTCMSGDWVINRVFTIATTNMYAIPDALSRGGRFNAVELRWPFFENNQEKFKSNQFHAAHIAYIVELFAATHCRLFNLTEVPAEFIGLLTEAQALKKALESIKPKWEKISFWPQRKLLWSQKTQIGEHIAECLQIPEWHLRWWIECRGYEFGLYLGDRLTERVTHVDQATITNIYKASKPKPQPDISTIRSLIIQILFQE